MIRVWGRQVSPNVQRAMFCIGELGLEFERIDVGGPFGGLASAEFLKMNPNGRIPTIQDGNTVVWESDAIIRYLAARYGAGTLWPVDPGERAAGDQWMEWARSYCDDGNKVFFQLYRVEAEKRDLKLMKECTESVTKAYIVLDRHLADKNFVAGEKLSIGDIAIGPHIHRYMIMDVQRPELPHLRAWYQRLLERPAYQAHIGFPLEEQKRLLVLGPDSVKK